MRSSTMRKIAISVLTAWYFSLVFGYLGLWAESRIPLEYFLVVLFIPLYAMYQVAAFVLRWTMIAGFSREIEPESGGFLERLAYFLVYFSGLVFLSGLEVYIFMGNKFPFSLS